MDSFADPTIREVVVMSSAQVGKTEILNNLCGYHIEHDPSPMLVVQPTLDMAQTWSKDRLAPMLRDTPSLAGLVKDPRSRDSGNTTLHKQFPGGHLTACGANSPSSLASRPVRVVLCDEVDRYPTSAGSEGDPVLLAKKRASTFWNRVIGLFSTPTNKGASRIESAFDESDQRRYFVPCPHCEHKQWLRWSQVKWTEPDDVRYYCESCGVGWDDAERFRAIKNGKWQATQEFTGVAGFHLSGLYSPWLMLRDCVNDFLEAKKSPETLRVFVNTFLGETWEDAGDQVDDYELASRKENWGDALPKEVLLLTAGVDVQDDRLEIEVVGWGKDEESWSVDYRQIYGDPSSPGVWNDLDQLLQGRYDHEHGEMTIRAACIDSGGHHTASVYKFAKTREGRRIYAIKGVGGEGKPIVGKPSTNNGQRVKLFPVGVDTVKRTLMSRFRIQEPGAGYCHFPEGRADEYFRQLTAEKLVTRYHKGFPRLEFVKVRTRNEALDARVYAMAALSILNANLTTMHNSMMQRQSIPVEQKAKPPVFAKKPSSFVNSWR
jgi:phage terminase large subunit GpA-like protein